MKKNLNKNEQRINLIGFFCESFFISIFSFFLVFALKEIIKRTESWNMLIKLLPAYIAWLVLFFCVLLFIFVLYETGKILVFQERRKNDE